MSPSWGIPMCISQSRTGLETRVDMIYPAWSWSSNIEYVRVLLCALNSKGFGTHRLFLFILVSIPVWGCDSPRSISSLVLGSTFACQTVQHLVCPSCNVIKLFIYSDVLNILWYTCALSLVLMVKARTIALHATCRKDLVPAKIIFFFYEFRFLNRVVRQSRQLYFHLIFSESSSDTIQPLDLCDAWCAAIMWHS